MKFTVPLTLEFRIATSLAIGNYKSKTTKNLCPEVLRRPALIGDAETKATHAALGSAIVKVERARRALAAGRPIDVRLND